MAKTVKKTVRDSSKTPLVSVVMSVYNGEKYLREAVDSILNQTFTDFEFIIINDGSTDDTLKIIKSYKDPRIVLISRENKGLVASLNEGTRKARGSYIARQDDDDVSMSDRLEKQVRYMREHSTCAVVGSRIREIDEDGMRYYREVLSNTLPNGSLELSLSFCNPLAHGSVLIRTALLRDVGLYDEKYWPAEDYELWVRMSKVGRLAVLDDELYFYRVNTAGISFTNIKKQNSIVRRIQAEFQENELALLPDERYAVSYPVVKKLFKRYLKELKIKNLYKLMRVHIVNLEERKKILLTSTARSIGGGEVYIQQILHHLSAKYDFVLLAPKELHEKLADSYEYKKIILPRWIHTFNMRGSYYLKLLWLNSCNLNRVSFVHMQQLDDVLSRLFYGKKLIIFTAHSRLDLHGDQLRYVKNMMSRVYKAVYVAHILEKDLKKLGLKKTQMYFIPNGVNGDGLLDLPLGRSRDEIIWVGRLEQQDKNPGLFLDTAHKLQNHTFVMYGEGSLREKLQERIESEGLSNVVIKGFVQDKAEIYERATVLCVTSESEAMPLVILEAFAAGVPVVSTAVGDVPLMLERGGGVCTPPEVEAVASNITKVMNKKATFSKQARYNYLENYQITATIAELDALYEEVLK